MTKKHIRLKQINNNNRIHRCKCIKCGKEFNAGSYKTKYCSHECRKVAYRCKCIKCGKEFNAATSSSKYCSTECRKNAYKCKCIVCDKEFTSSTNASKYCSTECKEKRIYKHLCALCGKEFTSNHGSVKYCSDECRERTYIQFYEQNKSKNKKLTNENYSNVISYTVKEIINKGIEARDFSGISRSYFDFGFTSSKKTEIQERDNYTCRICGKKHSLEVHHIIKVKHGGDATNDNLITLCRSCHRAIDTLNLDHAVKICLKNAEKNLFMSYEENTLSSKDKLDMTVLELDSIYTKLSKISDDVEINEILIRLGNVIENATTH